MLKQPPRLIRITSFQSSKLILWSVRVAGDAGVVDHDIDRADFGFDPHAAGQRRLVVAHVPFIGGDPGFGGEGAGLLLVPGIVGHDGAALFLQRKADCLADAAGAAGNDCDACHECSLCASRCLSLPSGCIVKEVQRDAGKEKPRDLRGLS